MAVNESLNVLGRPAHHTLSHSFPPCAGESCALSLPVTTSMSPCALIFTPATRRPAAIMALTALVTSCWRNVEGARAIGARKPASRSLQVIQAVADRPEIGLVVP